MPRARCAAVGRVWVETDLLKEVQRSAPYPFEPRVDGPADEGLEGAPAATFILGELTWPEAAERFRQVDVALLPVGSIEQHGPHLPLDTDAFDADLPPGGWPRRAPSPDRSSCR